MSETAEQLIERVEREHREFAAADPRPIHSAFGLTYAAYLCVPRLVLDAMPVEWQRQFVALLERLPATPEYVIELRGAGGQFVKDPLADYRHGKVPPEMLAEMAAGLSDAL